MKLALRCLLQHLGLASSSKSSPGIFPPLLVNVNEFFSPTITRTGVQTVLPPLLASSETFYGPSVTPGPVAVSLPLLVNANTFYGPQIALPGVTVAAPLLTNSQTFFGPKFNLNVKPPLLTNANVFFGPFVSRGAAQTIVPPKLTNTNTFFGPTLKGRAFITSPPFVNISTIYGPTVAIIGGSGEAITQYRGTLTKAAAGAVNIGSLSVTPYTATVTTYTLTSGTSGHWALPTDGTTPTPTTAGDTANLSGGPYVFDYTATVGSTTATGALTINTRADTYTVSKRSEVAAVLTAGIDGKTLEFARGATDLAQSTAASPLKFSGWRPTTSCTVQNEDPASPTKLGNLYIRCCDKVNFGGAPGSTDGLTIYPAARSSPTAIDKAFFVNTLTPSSFGLTSSSTNVCNYNNISVIGDGDPTHAVQSWYIQASGAPVGLTWTGLIQQTWCQDAINIYDSGDYGVTIDASDADVKTRYWTGDALFTTAGASGLGRLTFRDIEFMSPSFDSTRSAIHLDTWQNQADISNMPLEVDLFTVIQADGNVNGQAIFTKGVAKIALVAKNAIYCGRTVHAFTICGTDPAHETFGGNYTGIQQWSGIYGVVDTANGRNDRPKGAFPPAIVLEAGIDAAHIQLKNFVMTGNLSNVSSYTPPSDVHCINSPDMTAFFPNSAWISSPTLKSTAILAANDVDNYSGLDDARWHNDAATIRADVEAALTPASGTVGAMKSDGTRPLATFP